MKRSLHPVFHPALPALAMLIVGAMALLSARAEVTPAHRSSPEARLESIGKLIENSSAARQIEASQNTQAIAKRKEARELYAQAQEAYRKGDAQGATKLLDRAAKTMFEAVRLTEQGVVKEKQRADYQSRLESVQALLDAYQRISAEKHIGTQAQHTTEQIKT